MEVAVEAEVKLTGPISVIVKSAEAAPANGNAVVASCLISPEASVIVTELVPAETWLQ